MRTRLPARSTEPVSTESTPSSWAMTGSGLSDPL